MPAPGPAAGWPSPAPRHRMAAWDAIPAVLVVAVLMVRLLAGDAGGEPLLDAPRGLVRAVMVAGGAAVFALLLHRRRWPLPVLAATTAVCLPWMLLGYAGPSAALPIAVALYAVAVEVSSGALALAATATIALVGALAVVAGDAGPDDPPTVVPALILALAVALGLWTRSRRALVATYQQRVHDVETSREEEARRRVAEDRLRIARELHDVIAHHITVVNVQSSVAAHLLGTDPAAARQALEHVRRSSATVLDELGTVLGVLRSSDGAPLAPAVAATSLSGLSSLVEDFRATGAPITLDLTEVPALRPETETAAYRVVQEALTNAHKHAPAAPVHVSVRADTATLVLTIDNAAPARPVSTPAPGSGYGLRGMAERVRDAGGTLTAGRTPQAGFRIHAELPLEWHEPRLPEGGPARVQGAA